MHTTRRAMSKAAVGGGIWSEILEQAARTAEFPNSHLLLLGGRDVGKTALLTVLQKISFGQQKVTELEYHQDNNSVAAMDYAYLNVRNMDEEDTIESLAKMNVWMLQYAKHQSILERHYRAEYLKHTAVMICLDLSKPWSIREELTKWMDFVAQFIPNFLKCLPIDEQEELRDKLSDYVLKYKMSLTKETVEDFAKRHLDLSPIADDEQALKINLGIPIVVCVCKSDCAATLDTRSAQGHVDVVEAHLRQLCLPYGAALIFCSTKDNHDNRNVDLLYQYLMHRVHGFDFTELASNNEKDSIFFPSGWDNEEAVNEFVKTTVAETFDTPFSSIINRHTSASATAAATGRYSARDSDSTIRVDDMNTFLANAVIQIPSLASAGPPPPSAVSAGSVVAVHPPPPTTTSASATATTSTPLHTRERRSSRGSASEVVETSRGTGAVRRSDLGTARGDPASLRSFFQTLLVKGQKPTSPRGAAEDGAPEQQAAATSGTTTERKRSSGADRQSGRSAEGPTASSGRSSSRTGGDEAASPTTQ